MHVAKTEIAIDNQHVTKSLQRDEFLPKQPKENIEKYTNLPHFLYLDWVVHGIGRHLSHNYSVFIDDHHEFLVHLELYTLILKVPR